MSTQSVIAKDGQPTEPSLLINEFFFSIQGESSWAGEPTVFIRTTGCNLRCTYCDTKYSYSEGSWFSIAQIIDQVRRFYEESNGDAIAKLPKVCLTGGEPLLQSGSYELMQRLLELGFQVSLETSGSRSTEKVDPRVKVILDVKTPDSGEGQSFLIGNLSRLKPSDEVKFVICSENDFDWAERFCRQHKLLEKCLVLFSPSHEEIGAQWLAEKIISKKLFVRLQLQLHKYIWSGTTRGV